MKKLLVIALISMTVTPQTLRAVDRRVIEVKVKKFEFMPREIHLKKGEPVVLRFESLDRKHGFKVPSLGIEAVIKPGEITEVKVAPDKLGKFKFHCHLFCGSGHEGMNGTIYVLSSLPQAQEGREAPEAEIPPSALTHVNENYKRDVKPIFAQKCFDCHSSLGHKPWYASIPGPKWLIEKDIKDARAEMDMSQDFPFLGNGTPTDYLDVLEDAVKDDSMPPWRYRALHWNSKLTEIEKTIIQKWIETSRQELPE